MEDMLLNMARIGSFARDRAAFLISTDETDVLEEEQWIECLQPDFYVLTKKTQSFVIPTMLYSAATQLSRYTCKDADLTALSVLELMQRLAKAGWVEEAGQRSVKNRLPVKRDGPWVWYSDSKKAPSRAYLQTLLRASEIHAFCDSIHHGQVDKLPFCKCWLLCLFSRLEA